MTNQLNTQALTDRLKKVHSKDVKEAIIRRYQADPTLSYEACGRMYGVSRSTVHRWIHAKRKELRRKIGSKPKPMIPGLIAIVKKIEGIRRMDLLGLLAYLTVEALTIEDAKPWKAAILFCVMHNMIEISASGMLFLKATNEWDWTELNKAILAMPNPAQYEQRERS